MVSDRSSPTVGARIPFEYRNVKASATGTLAEVNPLRYRSYYYDEETGFYYLQSRYYDPETSKSGNCCCKT